MMVMSCRVRVVCFLLLNFLIQTAVAGNGLGTLGSTIVGSKHDLSISNYYGDGSSFGVTPSDQICVFCHTPHDANTDLNNDSSPDQDDAVRAPAPLWNRKITETNLSASFQPYGSAPGYQSYTLNTTFAGSWVPSPVSLVCLSCHDSALANSGSSGIVTTAGEFGDTHNLVNMPNRSGADTPNCAACHPGGGIVPPVWWQIGPDMSDDHPVSMPYPPTYAGWADDFYPAPNSTTGWTDVKLYKGRVECPSCHNPHNPGEIVYIDNSYPPVPVKYAPFLRATLDGSTLCITCHKK